MMQVAARQQLVLRSRARAGQRFERCDRAVKAPRCRVVVPVHRVDVRLRPIGANVGLAGFASGVRGQSRALAFR